MYWLGCHRFVALYIPTDSFTVRISARINSNTLRRNRGIKKYALRFGGGAKEIVQIAEGFKKGNWITVTREERFRVSIQCALDAPRHT